MPEQPPDWGAIRVRGAGENNLRDVSLDIPKRYVDNLIGLLERLVESGRTVIVIEHDLGPGAGHDGGRVIFEGPPAELARAKGSLTGEHLRRRLEVGTPA